MENNKVNVHLKVCEPLTVLKDIFIQMSEKDIKIDGRLLADFLKGNLPNKITLLYDNRGVLYMDSSGDERKEFIGLDAPSFIKAGSIIKNQHLKSCIYKARKNEKV